MRCLTTNKKRCLIHSSDIPSYHKSITRNIPIPQNWDNHLCFENIKVPKATSTPSKTAIAILWNIGIVMLHPLQSFSQGVKANIRYSLDITLC